MPHMTPDNAFVVICDWHGRLVWRSSEELRTVVGDYVWKFITKDQQDLAKAVFSRTVTLRESQIVEVTGDDGYYFRIWLWPLDSPEAAVCVLAMRIPAELKDLTAREKECLGLLAQGMTTRQMAAEMDISLSTVHTHLKRIKEKLGIDKGEALISFAARFCHPKLGPADFGEPGDGDKSKG